MRWKSQGPYRGGKTAEPTKNRGLGADSKNENLLGRGKAMVKKIVSLLAIAFLLVPVGAHAACSLQFSVAGGPAYANNQLAAFIEQQVRPRLTSTPGSFEIDVLKACQGAASGRLALQMDQTDYYITAVQGHPLAPAESTYNNDNVALTEANLESAIDAAISFDQLPSPPSTQRPDVVKVLAYFLAESARFTSIEQIDTALMNGNCAAQWLNYAQLVRRWGVLSRFAIHLGRNDWSARGGTGGRLIAPISDAVISL
jgi:hypothetical protein